MSDITMDIQYNTAWQKYTELSGELGMLQNKLANIQLYDLGRIGCAIAIACIFSVCIYAILWAIFGSMNDDMFSPHLSEKYPLGMNKAKYITIAMFIILCFVLSIILIMSNHISIENNLASIEAQMDALNQVWGFDADISG